MIWSITSKDEFEHYGITSVYRFYEEAIGKGNIKLAVVDETDSLDFVSANDVILLRTASESLVNAISRKGVKSTTETFSLYEKVKDKKELSDFMKRHNVVVPNQYSPSDIEDGKTYFVKPRFGSDSFGINDKSICRSKRDVIRQKNYIEEELHREVVIEDYIKGIECTVACIRKTDTSVILTCPMMIDCSETNGIQTRECKVGYKECCSAICDEKLNKIATSIFQLLGVKSHARMDFRKGMNGEYYLIDINLLPGLGPLDHLAKSLLLCKNMSYIDALQAVISSAS